MSLFPFIPQQDCTSTSQYSLGYVIMQFTFVLGTCHQQTNQQQQVFFKMRAPPLNVLLKFIKKKEPSKRIESGAVDQVCQLSAYYIQHDYTTVIGSQKLDLLGARFIMFSHHFLVFGGRLGTVCTHHPQSVPTDSLGMRIETTSFHSLSLTGRANKQI